MGLPTIAPYRGFRIAVFCDPATEEHMASSSIAFLTCHPENKCKTEFEKITMRHAIILEEADLSAKAQRAMLVASARKYIDDYHSRKNPHAAEGSPSGGIACQSAARSNPISAQMEPHGTERRGPDRRANTKDSRLLLRVLSIQRVFGATTASQMLRRAGMEEEPLRALMALVKDRRRVKRRGRELEKANQ